MLLVHKARHGLPCDLERLCAERRWAGEMFWIKMKQPAWIFFPLASRGSHFSSTQNLGSTEVMLQGTSDEVRDWFN